MSPLNVLLGRLVHVHKTGRGWRADCPTGHRSRGSLSIAEGDTGTLLVKCWSGCSVLQVLGAIGLQLSDLYPERANLRELAPEERVRLKAAAREAGWSAALKVLDREANLVAIAAEMLHLGQDLAPDDMARLRQALCRIGDARAALR